jgi:hypothetical protein
MEIGVAPGIRIKLSSDCEPLCYGASMEESLDYAEQKATSAKAEQLGALLQ